MSAFVLERFNWRRVRPTAWLRLPGENPVSTFATAEEAQSEQAQRESDAQTVVMHPFRCGGSLRELTTLPDVVFLDWLRDAGIDPPDPDPDGRLPWLAWADLFHTEWTPNQLAHVWEGCNRVRFYRVRERSADRLFCCVRVRWSPEMNDANYEPDSEGGVPCALWHHMENAERDREVKQRFAADEVAGGMEMAGEGAVLLDPRKRIAAAEPFAELSPLSPVDVRAGTHCELVEVERGDDSAVPLGERAFVVLRLSWDSEGEPDGEPGHFDHHSHDYGPNPLRSGVPVRVFRTCEDAERLRDEWEAEYRAFTNPFRFDLPTLSGRDDDHGRLLAAIAELGLTPPAIPMSMIHDYYPRRLRYAAWWDRQVDTFTTEQLAALWGFVPKQNTALWGLTAGLRFHEVREAVIADARALPPRWVRTMYYVRATNWIPDGGPNLNPLRFLGAFANRDRAEEVRTEADRQARTNQTPLPMERDYNPNAHWWERLSSWSKADMRRHFVEHGLVADENAADFVPYPYWWNEIRPRLRPSQAAAFWEVLDRVRLYEILPLETEVPS